jgi:hypothetical protein
MLEMFPEAFREMEPDYPRERQVEQATAGPGEKRTTIFPPEPPRPEGLRHVGGGVFETPDGERFRGRADALAHMNPEED